MPPIRATFDRAFAVLRHDWVHDFFFAHASQTPALVRHATATGPVSTLELDVTGAPAPSPVPDSPAAAVLHVAEHHRLLLMASFSTGHITVGFAVNEKIASASPFVSRERFLGRVARDDRAGTCLFIADTYSKDVAEVTFFTLHSPAHREHLFSLFDGPAFRRAVAAMRGRFRTSLILPHLVYYYASIEARPCPTCGARTPTDLDSCACRLALPEKKHAMDLDAEMQALRCYTGGYCGVARLEIFQRGESLARVTFANKSAMVVTRDVPTGKRLADWAMRKVVRERPVSPLAFTMGRGGAATCGNAVSVLDSFLLASIADSVLSEESSRRAASGRLLCSAEEGGGEEGPVGGAAGAEIDVGGGGECEEVVPSPLAAGEPLLAGGTDGALSDAQSCPLVQRLSPPPLQPPRAVPVLPGMPEPPQQPLPVRLAPSPVLYSPKPYAPGHDPFVLPSPDRGHALGTPAAGAAVAANFLPSSSTTLSVSSTEQGVGAAGRSTSVEPRPEPRRLTPTPLLKPMARFILPLQPRAIPPLSGGVSKFLGEDLDERRRKAELRKARNRESAQRSNHKRKLRIQALKNDIAEAMRKEMNLRAKEKMLREENRSLRLTVSK